MARMTKVKVLCLVAAFAVVLQVSIAAPVAEGRESNEVVDEILMRLKQLRQQSEATSNVRLAPAYSRPEEVYRVHRTLDNLGGGYLLKRGMDSLGGGYLLKRNLGDSPRGNSMDSLGGGYLL